jgi:hypothetical protein
LIKSAAVFQARIDGQAKYQTENTNQDAPEEQFVTVNAAEKMHGREIGSSRLASPPASLDLALARRWRRQRGEAEGAELQKDDSAVAN